MEKLVISYYYYGIEDDTHEAILPFEYESKESAIKFFADLIEQRSPFAYSKFCNREFDMSYNYEILTLDEWFEQNKLIDK